LAKRLRTGRLLMVISGEYLTKYFMGTDAECYGLNRQNYI